MTDFSFPKGLSRGIAGGLSRRIGILKEQLDSCDIQRRAL